MQRNRAFVSSQVSNWVGNGPITRIEPTIVAAVSLMRLYGSSTTEGISGIEVDSLDNIYISGTASDNAYVAKIDSNRNISWQKQYSTATDGFTDIALNETTGFVYSCGYWTTGFPNERMYLTKHNLNGTLQWQTQLNGSYDDWFTGMAINSSDDIFLSGCWVPSNMGYFAGKYNSSGTLQWQTGYAISGQQNASNYVAIDSSSNVFITGGLGANSGDWYTVKLNSSGSVLWQRRLSTASADGGNGITTDSSGNVYATGNSAGTGVLIKFDTNGSILWQKSISTSALYDCRVGSDGFLYILGAGPSNGQSIFKYSLSGTLQWQRTLTNSAGSIGGNRIRIKGNKFYLGGSLNNGSNSDIFIGIFPTDGTGIGTYTLGGMTITYGSGSYTESSSSYSFADPGLGWQNPGLGASSASLTESTSTLTLEKI